MIRHFLFINLYTITLYVLFIITAYAIIDPADPFTISCNRLSIAIKSFFLYVI